MKLVSKEEVYNKIMCYVVVIGRGGGESEVKELVKIVDSVKGFY